LRLVDLRPNFFFLLSPDVPPLSFSGGEEPDGLSGGVAPLAFLGDEDMTSDALGPSPGSDAKC
jgi:hypothetical protein